MAPPKALTRATRVGQLVNPAAVATIRDHIPSLTQDDEDDIAGILPRLLFDIADKYDIADLAIRTCACGVHIDGFYEYVDHLVAVFGGESHFGG